MKSGTPRAGEDPALGAGRQVAQATDAIGLEGPWEARLGSPESDPLTATLPGSLDSNGIGDPVTEPEPGRLTRPVTYTGPAWYEREVTIPETWAGQSIHLFLERCHWETELQVDGAPAGRRNSLIAPHVYPLDGLLGPGTHCLALRIDNTMKIPVGEWACAVTDETQTLWNGVSGRMELVARAPVHLVRARIDPDPDAPAADVEVFARNTLGHEAPSTMAVQCVDAAGKVLASEEVRAGFRPGVSSLRMTVALPPDAPRWDPRNPRLLSLRVALETAASRSELSESFGLRSFRADTHHFMVNGQRVFLRGNTDAAQFPRTGYPPADREYWDHYFGTFQDYGMNHVRFHSWCPPEAAFQAADALGFILQVEAPQWVPHGDVGTDPARAEFVQEEARRILRWYGNHPSFCMMAFGNELGAGDDPILVNMLSECQDLDRRRVYTTTMRTYAPGQRDDFFESAALKKATFVRGQKRVGLTKAETLYDYDGILEEAGADKPIVSHETGQYAMFPDLRDLERFNGVLRPRYLEPVPGELEARGMGGQAEAFGDASGALMVALYKEEVESALRSRTLAGFQMLGLYDVTGWGAALIGVLNGQLESKGLITPAEWRSFCGPVTPLARMASLTWTTDQTFEASVEVANQGPQDLRTGDARWQVETGDGEALAQGRFDDVLVAAGRNTPVGHIAAPLGELPAPAACVLRVSVAGGAAANSWRLWLYPPAVDVATPEGVTVTESWDDAKAALAEGGCVLFVPDLERLPDTVPGRLAPVFWSQRLFPQQPGTMGLLCQAEHPALAAFPTDTHSDFQWWEIVDRSRAMILDDAPATFRPIVQPIDNFQRNHKLGMLFEARVGPGRLMVCLADLANELDERPVARQLRASVLRHMAGPGFQPEAELGPDLLDRLFAMKDVARPASAGAAGETA